MWICKPEVMPGLTCVLIHWDGLSLKAVLELGVDSKEALGSWEQASDGGIGVLLCLVQGSRCTTGGLHPVWVSLLVPVGLVSSAEPLLLCWLWWHLTKEQDKALQKQSLVSVCCWSLDPDGKTHCSSSGVTSAWFELIGSCWLIVLMLGWWIIGVNWQWLWQWGWW